MARIELEGPFFRARDPSQTIRDNIRDWLVDIAREMEGEVVDQMRSGEAARQPVRALGRDARVSEHIRGRVESLSRKPWHYWAVVSADQTGMNAREAVALQAAASKIEGRSHPFGRVGRAERRALRDLAKGLE